MKTMRGNTMRFALIIPILFLVLVACGTNGSDSGDSASGEDVTIEFFNQKPEITRQLEDLAQTYSEQNEGVEINISTIGSGEGAAGLQAKFTSGNPPAIMMLGGTAEIERYQDTLLEVGDLEVADTMMPNLLEGGVIGDQ